MAEYQSGVGTFSARLKRLTDDAGTRAPRKVEPTQPCPEGRPRGRGCRRPGHSRCNASQAPAEGRQGPRQEPAPGSGGRESFAHPRLRPAGTSEEV